VAADEKYMKKLEKTVDERTKGLMDEKNYVRHLIESSPDFQVTLDKDGEIMDANKAFEGVIGKSHEDVIGTSVYEYLPKENTEKIIADIFEKGKVRDIELTADIPGRGNILCNFSGTVFTTSEGEKGVYITGRDITERKKAENDLQKSEKKFHSLYSTMNEGVCLHEIIYDESGEAVDYRIIDINPSYEKILSITRGQAVGSIASELYGAGEPPYLEVYAKVTDSGEPVSFETYFSPIDKYFNISVFSPDKGKFATVFSDITKRKKAEEKIKQQNIQLRRLNRIKSEFLNITSHELRTPMTAMKGYIQMLLNQTLGGLTDEQQKALDIVLQNTNRLNNLIQDILDTSLLESGSMKFSPEKTDMNQLMKETAEAMQPSVDIKGLTINLDVEKGIPELVIDQDRIKQVMMNLVNNAIKFSADESVINVRAKKQEENVLVEIQDYGKGIPKNKQKKVFEMFYQVDSGMDRSFEGTGLGLSISRGIVLGHGGKIWVESKLGKGSIFRFMLPIKPFQDVEGTFKEIDMFNAETDKEKSRGGNNIPKILIVDDEPDTRGMLNLMLQKEGLETEDAGMEEDALQICS